MLLSLTKNIAKTNPMINNTNPVILYLNDIIVVVRPLFVSAVPKKRMKTVVTTSIILYFFNGNSFQKSCSLVDWWYRMLAITATAPIIHSSFHIRTIFQNVLSRPIVYVTNVCAINCSIRPMKNIFIAVETIEAMLFLNNMTMCIVVKIIYGNRGILNW